MQNTNNNIGMGIQSSGVSEEYDGEIRGCLVNLYVAQLGSTGGTGVKINTYGTEAVTNNQCFLLATSNLSDPAVMINNGRASLTI
jgi:hypothetical protein